MDGRSERMLAPTGKALAGKTYRRFFGKSFFSVFNVYVDFLDCLRFLKVFRL